MKNILLWLSRMEKMEILTLLLVIITGIYALLTYAILKANKQSVEIMRQQIEASTRPYVLFDVVPYSEALGARVVNSGNSGAHDVTVKTEPLLRKTCGRASEPAKIIGSPITFLAPGREVVEFIGGWEDVERGCGGTLRWNVEVSYLDGAGRRYHEKFCVDVTGLRGMSHNGRPTVESLMPKRESEE